MLIDTHFSLNNQLPTGTRQVEAPQDRGEPGICCRWRYWRSRAKFGFPRVKLCSLPLARPPAHQGKAGCLAHRERLVLEQHPEVSTPTRSPRGSPGHCSCPKGCRDLLRLCPLQHPDASGSCQHLGERPAHAAHTDMASASLRLSVFSLLLGNWKLAGTESSVFNSRNNKILLIILYWL